MPVLRSSALLPLLFAFLTGCGDAPPRVEAPPLSPRQSAENAISFYDVNKDGAIDEHELQKCPGLRDAVAKIDKDQDGKLNVQEIADRLTYIENERIGYTSFACLIRANSYPLAGATVTLEPEKFIASAIKPATGITDKNGLAHLKAEGAIDGVNCGYYRVQVSKKDAQGQETIASEFNSGSKLGKEIAPDTLRTPTFDVVSQ